MGYSKRMFIDYKKIYVNLNPELVEKIVTLRDYYKLDTNTELVRKLVRDKYNEVV